MKKVLFLGLGSIFFSCAFFGYTTPVQAAPPQNFQTTLVAGSNLNGPSGFAFAPDGRIFILERAGKVKVYKNGQVLATPFVDLPSAASGDRGLIGIAFDPDFATNHYVYFWYCSSGDFLNRLVRFDASADVATADPVLLYQTNTPSQELHVGGGLAFGPDGKLYLGVGDNGYSANAQNLAVPFGKMLRINKDGTVPADNPFYNQFSKIASAAYICRYNTTLCKKILLFLI
jgi:glucose/arabinose dehydrogenase